MFVIVAVDVDVEYSPLDDADIGTSENAQEY